MSSPNPGTERAGATEVGPGDDRSVLVPPKSRRRIYTVIGVGVVIVIVVLASAAVLTDGFKRPTSSATTTVLVPAGTIDSLPTQQFNAVDIDVTSGTASVTGSVGDSYGLQLFTMNLSQFHFLIVKGVVGSYLWTSGVLGNVSMYNIDLAFTTGQWVLVFYNPNNVHSFLTTSVGFYTNLDLNT